MSTTDPTGSSTGADGQQAVGTSGSSLSNPSSTTLSSNEFLDLMMTELENQDPLSPSSSDPTQYLSQLAQLTSVEQETDTAQNTQESATEQAVSQSVSLIGQTVTYSDQTTGADVTGTVNSVQITSSGPTLTIGGTAGIDPAYVIAVAPAGTSGSDDSGDGESSNSATPSAQTPDTGATDTSGATGSTDTSGSDSSGSDSDSDPFVF
jgi:flagellar basal-body rod modification protein FlgD